LASSPARAIHPVEKALLGVPVRDILTLVPGILLAAVVSVAANGLAEFLGTTVMGFDKSPISGITLAILIGLVIRNTVGVPAIMAPGVDFCLKKLLRLGIILLGIRLSLIAVLQISASAIPIVVLVVGSALLLVWQFARRLHLPDRLGLLTAVGTSICGVSAIVSTAPCIDASEEEVSYAVANITLFGLLAMFLYPFLAHTLFGGQAMMTGLFLGTSIHDTAQVTGAGLIYDSQFLGKSPTAGEIAVVTKLVRNTLMAAVIPLVSLVYARRICNNEQQQTGKGSSFWRYLPVFVLGFVGLAIVRTVGDATLDSAGRALGLFSPMAWSQLTGAVAEGGNKLLAVAMASVGLGTSYKVLKGLGIRPFLLGLTAAVLVGALSSLLIWALSGVLIA